MVEEIGVQKCSWVATRMRKATFSRAWELAVEMRLITSENRERTNKQILGVSVELLNQTLPKAYFCGLDGECPQFHK